MALNDYVADDHLTVEIDIRLTRRLTIFMFTILCLLFS